MKLRIGLLAMVLAVGAVLASAGLAQPPVKEPLVSEPMEFPAGVVCPFPVLGESVSGNESITFFASGRFHITGEGSTRFTNLETQESIVLDTSGVVTFTPLEDGNLAITGSGRNVFYFLPQDVEGAGLFLITGRISEILDSSTDTITSSSSTGQRVDVCAALS
ncbi:MAG TPA: hypothetical protein VK896_02460 [Gaiellaceae bacterium]|nr:hypothetical protein [Gaiellaceae bacterium]